MPISEASKRRVGISASSKISRTLSLVMLTAASLSQAGQPMTVCRDANGKAYFSDRGCPVLGEVLLN